MWTFGGSVTVRVQHGTFNLHHSGLYNIPESIVLHYFLFGSWDDFVVMLVKQVTFFFIMDNYVSHCVLHHLLRGPWDTFVMLVLESKLCISGVLN